VVDKEVSGLVIEIPSSGCLKVIEGNLLLSADSILSKSGRETPTLPRLSLTFGRSSIFSS
jgi:hypothetical protein